jgi:hypothetical protein
MAPQSKGEEPNQMHLYFVLLWFPCFCRFFSKVTDDKKPDNFGGLSSRFVLLWEAPCEIQASSQFTATSELSRGFAGNTQKT